MTPHNNKDFHSAYHVPTECERVSISDSISLIVLFSIRVSKLGKGDAAHCFELTAFKLSSSWPLVQRPRYQCIKAL